jgi:hypothetical protein
MTIGQTALKTKAALAAAALLALPTLARAEAGTTYYERAFVVAADAPIATFRRARRAWLRSGQLGAVPAPEEAEEAPSAEA